jgi:DNA-binding beta-propeller fold protein YncE
MLGGRVVGDAKRRARRQGRVGPTATGRGRGLRFGLVVLVLPAIAGCVRFTEPKLQPLIQEVPARVEIPPLTGKSGKVDIMAVDQASHRLYVADGLLPGIDVFDVTNSPGRFIETTHTDAIPSGITLAPELHRLYAGMDDSTVRVFDTDPSSTHPYAQIARIETTGQGPADLMDYDPKQRKVYVTSPDDGFLESINVDTNLVVNKIEGLGLIEQPRYDPADGMVYVISPDRDSIFQIDPTIDKVVKENRLGVTCSPNGLAINPATNQGLIGCSDRDQPSTLSWDFGTGHLMRVFDQSGAGDALIFDADAQHFYFAASNYSPAEIAIFNANPIDFLTAVPTSHGSHTVAFDEANQTIYAFDAKHLEAGMWAFRDPVAGCFGPDAQRVLFASSGGHVPGCHVLGSATPSTARRS